MDGHDERWANGVWNQACRQSGALWTQLLLPAGGTNLYPYPGVPTSFPALSSKLDQISTALQALYNAGWRFNEYAKDFVFKSCFDSLPLHLTAIADFTYANPGLSETSIRNIILSAGTGITLIGTVMTPLGALASQPFLSTIRGRLSEVERDLVALNAPGGRNTNFTWSSICGLISDLQRDIRASIDASGTRARLRRRAL